jgi:LysR family transcriptional regulator, glycine cleavage system transcriptional activator
MTGEINLKLLRTFEAVARNRSFTKAAEELRRSQATVSSQVGVFELQLGVPLIERTSRRVSLTAAGEELAGVLGRAFRLIDDGLNKVRDRPCPTNLPLIGDPP